MCSYNLYMCSRQFAETGKGRWALYVLLGMEQVIGYEVARACHSIATTTFQIHNGTKHNLHKISKKRRILMLHLSSRVK